MSILTAEEKKFLEESTMNQFVNSGYVQSRIKVWAKKNFIDEENYQRRFLEDDSLFLSLENHMKNLENEELISRDEIIKSIHSHYDLIEKWVNQILEKKDKNIHDIDNKQHFDYAYVAVLDILGIGALEKMFEKNN
jgi:hypothetical protein